MITYVTGTEIDPLEFKPSDFDLLDAAHAMARLGRFSGHVRDFRSVARHCVEVAGYLRSSTQDPEAAMLGLLHDVPEVYTGCSDVLGRIKRKIAPEVKSLEDKILLAVYEAVGLEYPEYAEKAVKVADRLNLNHEQENGLKNRRHRGFDADMRDWLSAYRTLMSEIVGG